jgi:hypothetical protein
MLSLSNSVQSLPHKCLENQLLVISTSTRLRLIYISRDVPSRKQTLLVGCSNWNPFKKFAKRQNAANLCVFAFLKQASQASDVGSIPIARSKHPCVRPLIEQSIDLARLSYFLYRPAFVCKTKCHINSCLFPPSLLDLP